jgi:hypothetical protein
LEYFKVSAAALASILLMLAWVSQPHIAFLVAPRTNSYSDLTHPENEPLSGDRCPEAH